MPISPETLAIAAEFRVVLDDTVDAQTRQLVAAWARAWDTMAGLWQSAADAAATGELTAADVASLDRVRTALDAAAEQLGKLLAANEITATGAASELVTATQHFTPLIIASQLPSTAGPTATLASTFSRFDPVAFEAIVTRTAQQITSLSAPLSIEATDAMKRALIRGIAQGMSPREVAQLMVTNAESGFNGGLARALTISRTEILDAYRESARQAQDVNADVLRGWEWQAELDDRTCFPAGTPITTRRGQIPIERVNVGDQVLTHTGAWRNVYDTTHRQYTGTMITVEAGDLHVTATGDHPFLIEREGNLEWVKARAIRHGDCILSNRQNATKNVDHGGSVLPVERPGRDPQNGPPPGLQEEGFGGVALLGLGMPIGVVNFEGDLQVMEEEVNALGLASLVHAGYDTFLLEGDAERFEADADVLLRDRLSVVSLVAPHGTESGAAGRDNPYRLPALQTFDHDRRSATFFGTELAVRRTSEDRPAPPAPRVDRVGAPAFDRTHLIPVGVAVGHPKRLATLGAGLLHRVGGLSAFHRAMLLWPALTRLVRRATLRTRPDNAGLRVGTDAAVGVSGLVCGVAGTSTELPTAPPNPTWRNVEMGSAVLTSPFHRHIVSKLTARNQSLTVHNIEVDQDHSYIAAGIVVHNCSACWALDGTFHELSEPGPDGHQQCRCARLPVSKSWKDLGFDIEEPESVRPDAQSMFDAMTEEQQLRVMGRKRLDALRTGTVKWADLATERSTPGWRRSFVPTPVGNLISA